MSAETVAIIDYGSGNLHSAAKAFERAAREAGLDATRIVLTSEAEAVAKADRVVLPGVGGVRACMAELQRLELDAFVREQSKTKPLLGICLGMQVLLDHSEENDGVDCIGLFPGQVRGR